MMVVFIWMFRISFVRQVWRKKIRITILKLIQTIMEMNIQQKTLFVLLMHLSLRKKTNLPNVQYISCCKSKTGQVINMVYRCGIWQQIPNTLNRKKKYAHWPLHRHLIALIILLFLLLLNFQLVNCCEKELSIDRCRLKENVRLTLCLSCAALYINCELDKLRMISIQFEQVERDFLVSMKERGRELRHKKTRISKSMHKYDFAVIIIYHT